MGLTDDEKSLLEELTRKSEEPDADEDYEIEIFAGDKGARVPFSKGKKWLFETFGIGDPPEAPAGDDDGQADDGKSKAAGQGSGPARKSYFAKKQAR